MGRPLPGAPGSSPCRSWDTSREERVCFASPQGREAELEGIGRAGVLRGAHNLGLRNRLVSVEVSILEDPEILMSINNSAVPEVTPLDRPKARWLLAHSILSSMVVLDGEVAGVMVALSETSGLDSEYYRWFTERYSGFVYVDRVIVSAWARGRGLATLLYREVEAVAAEHGLAIATEVYSEPPNAPSLAFHARMGYHEVGTQYSETEGKTVSKLMKYQERSRSKTG